MAWVALVETVIDMRVSILFTNLLTLNVMTLMAKYHKKKTDYEKQYRFEPSILIRMVIKSS